MWVRYGERSWYRETLRSKGTMQYAGFIQKSGGAYAVFTYGKLLGKYPTREEAQVVCDAVIALEE
jgi:hypothetical protein